MGIPLLDVQCGFGGFRPGVREIVSADDCIAEMDRLDVQRALVRITPCELDKDVRRSNELLYEAHRRHARLIPCPTVVPYCGDEIPKEETQVDEALANGAGAVVLRPQDDLWLLEEWCCGKLLAALEDRAVPVLCQTSMVPLPDAARIAERRPALPLVITGINYRTYRTLWRLLEAFDNVLLSIGLNFAMHRAIEELVKAFGPERMLFGTGWPDVEMMPAITQLMYADISNGDKQLIGSGNLERLMGGIRR